MEHEFVIKTPNWQQADQLVYLHNAVEQLNSGLPRTNPVSSRVEDLNQGPPDFKSGSLKSFGNAAT